MNYLTEAEFFSNAGSTFLATIGNGFGIQEYHADDTVGEWLETSSMEESQKILVRNGLPFLTQDA